MVKYLMWLWSLIPKYDALREELDHFIHSIQHSKKPATDGYSATKALRLALKIQSIIDQ